MGVQIHNAHGNAGASACGRRVSPSYYDAAWGFFVIYLHVAKQRSYSNVVPRPHAHPTYPSDEDDAGCAWRIGAASNVRSRRCYLAEERSTRHKGKSQPFILRRQMAGDHSSTTLTLTDMSSLCSSRASVFLVCFSNGMFRSSNSDQIDSLSSPAV